MDAFHTVLGGTVVGGLAACARVKPEALIFAVLIGAAAGYGLRYVPR